MVDAFAGLIPGWECSMTKHTDLVEAAIRQAAARRRREGHPLRGTVHHSDYAEPCVKPRDRGMACAGRVALSDSSA